MSQQINLLRSKARPGGPAAMAIGSVVVLLLGLGVYYQSLSSETARLRAAADASAQRVAQLKGVVDARQGQKNSKVEATALTAEINILRPRADLATQLVRDARSGALGSQEGFARYFSTLAGVAEEGVWVTGVNVSKGGSLVAVSGRAIRNESVVLYARRLNAAFAPHGVKFNALEMAPETVTKPTPSGVPAVLTSIAFKIS